MFGIFLFRLEGEKDGVYNIMVYKKASESLLLQQLVSLNDYVQKNQYIKYFTIYKIHCYKRQR